MSPAPGSMQRTTYCRTEPRSSTSTPSRADADRIVTQLAHATPRSSQRSAAMQRPAARSLHEAAEGGHQQLDRPALRRTSSHRDLRPAHPRPAFTNLTNTPHQHTKSADGLHRLLRNSTNRRMSDVRPVRLLHRPVRVGLDDALREPGPVRSSLTVPRRGALPGTARCRAGSAARRSALRPRRSGTSASR
jgi:hypothetical protein